MATVGDGGVTTGINPTYYYWVPQQHQHAAHVHALAYCVQCDAAYCTLCNRQWGGYSVTWASNTSLPVTTTTSVYYHGGH